MSEIKPNKDAHARVLVVDDGPEWLNSMTSLLEVYGYKVRAEQNAKCALAHVNNGTADLIVLDVDDLGMPSEEFFSEVKRFSGDIPVIATSQTPSVDTLVDMAKQGVRGFVRKPFMADELVNAVRDGLEQAKEQRHDRQVQERVRESEHLHRFMVNNFPDIIYMLDSEGCFSYLNDSVKTLLGYQKNELVGVHFSELLHGDANKKDHAFNERRADIRNARHEEVFLKRKTPGGRSSEFNLVPFEVNAMGVYSKPDDNGERVFLGTYGIARDISSRKEAESLIRFQAEHDLLTGLPNRVLLRDRLQLAIAQAKRRRSSLVVMFLDLDRFKIVNDTLGHSVGDQLLQVISRRLQGCIREADTLARFGGDEFALLLPEVQERQDAEMIAQKIIAVLEAPVHIDEHELYVSASIGIAVYPDAGETIDALIQNADIAMYHIKANGKNGYHFFDQYLSEALSKRLSMERDLHRAIKDDQFEVLYQPLTEGIRGDVVYLEALMRWNHPESGLMNPDEFMPIAEETGIIVQLGQATLLQVCQDIQQWRDQFGVSVKVSVNFSAVQLSHPSFVVMLTQAVTEYELQRGQLIIELNENTLMKDRERTLKKLNVLHDHGVCIALDDFGAGFTSLSTLHQLPLSALKLDRSFLHDINGEPREVCIVSAIVAMAKGLRLDLVAVGVETWEQYEYLRNLGCYTMQGYFISPPLHRKIIEERLRSGAFKWRPVSLQASLPLE